ncbi:hypothetical protein V6Z11_D10G133300 [Gossypium hirsutum]
MFCILRDSTYQVTSRTLEIWRKEYAKFHQLKPQCCSNAIALNLTGTNWKLHT